MRDLIKKILIETVREGVIKWTDEMLRREALKYNTRGQFQKLNPNADAAARSRGSDFYNDITSHMNFLRKTWNDDDLKNEIKKYNTIKDLRINNPAAYQASRNRGKEFFGTVTSHMVPSDRTLKWTKDKAMEIAKKYDKVGDFYKNEPALTQTAKKKGWIQDITKHMSRKHKKWTKQQVLKIAKKYTTKKDFFDNDYLAFAAAKNNGWYEEATAHMKPLGNLKKREVYVYEFPDKSVYVGLTMSTKKRNEQHLSDGDKTAVSRYIKFSNLTPIMKVITAEFIDAEDAQKLEEKTIQEYELSGWKILNKAKAGGLGGGVTKWTKETISNIAKKYKNSTDFRKENLGAYLVAKEKGWFNELTSHMIKPKKWTRDEVIQIAQKYTTRNEFGKKEPHAYSAARKRGWMEDATKHMRGVNIKWDKDMVQKIADKYEYILDFTTQEPKAYAAAKTNGWLQDVTKNMKKKFTTWTYDYLMSILNQYDNIKDFKSRNRNAWEAVVRKNWLEDVQDFYEKKSNSLV